MTYFALVLALLAPRQATRPAQIILFRHAEKPADKADPHLSPEGVQRARKLVGFLATDPVVNKYGKPVAIFATKTTKDDDGQRTQETVAPAAASLKLAVQTPFVGKDYQQLAKLILGNPAYAGKTVVICWNHDVISELVGRTVNLEARRFRRYSRPPLTFTPLQELTMADASVRGRILWYELLTTDMNAAEKFYTAVVGWTAAPFGQGPDPYTMFMRSGDTPVAGVMNIPQGMNFPPHWGMYVGVPNLDAGVAQVEKLKGSALSPVIDVPGIGRMRTMIDPQGAAFSIYEPATPPAPEAKPELGDVSWHELMTTDAPAALKFYGEMFGWKERNAFDMGPMGTYYEWGRDWELGGMMKKPAELANVPPHWGFYFRVDDVTKGAERVKQHGGQVVNGPMEVPGGTWIVNCVDPQGAHFSLHHVNA